MRTLLIAIAALAFMAAPAMAVPGEVEIKLTIDEYAYLSIHDDAENIGRTVTLTNGAVTGAVDIFGMVTGNANYTMTPSITPVATPKGTWTLLDPNPQLFTAGQTDFHVTVGVTGVSPFDYVTAETQATVTLTLSPTP